MRAPAFDSSLPLVKLLNFVARSLAHTRVVHIYLDRSDRLSRHFIGGTLRHFSLSSALLLTITIIRSVPRLLDSIRRVDAFARTSTNK